jgi:hypothetical protein
MRLRRLSAQALRANSFTPELERVRAEPVSTFTHFLDLPLLLVIVALGVLKPQDWTMFFTGCAAALALAVALTVYVPRLYRKA